MSVFDLIAGGSVSDVLGHEIVHREIMPTSVIVIGKPLVELDVFPIVVVPKNDGPRVEVSLPFVKTSGLDLSLHDLRENVGIEVRDDEFFGHEGFIEGVEPCPGEGPHPRENVTVCSHHVPFRELTLPCASFSIAGDC